MWSTHVSTGMRWMTKWKQIPMDKTTAGGDARAISAKPVLLHVVVFAWHVASSQLGGPHYCEVMLAEGKRVREGAALDGG